MTSDLETDELSASAAEVHGWFVLLMRAVRAIQLYPVDSPVRAQHLEVVHHGLTQLLASRGQLHLHLRDQEVLYDNEVVFTSQDEKAFTNILFAASVIELSFFESVSLEELDRLLVVVLADYTRAAADGEDLATALWRLELPNVRYHHVDLLAVSVRSDLTVRRHHELDDPETRRLRQQLDAITGALAVDQTNQVDVVALLDGALETPEARDAAVADAQRSFAMLQAHNRQRVPGKALRAFALELTTKDTHEEITIHLTTLLLDALRREERPYDPSAALEFLLILFNRMIESDAYDDARRLVLRLVTFARRAKDAREAEFAHRFLSRFASREFVTQALHALGRLDHQQSARVFGYLRALGRYAVPAILDDIDDVEAPVQRRLLCELLVEVGGRHMDRLVAKVESATFEVGVAMLQAGSALEDTPRSRFVWAGLKHDHPRVRVAALQMLRRFEGHAAERAVVHALNDNDSTVVQAALRIAMAKRLSGAFEVVETIMERGTFRQQDPRFIQLTVDTYATIGGDGAIPGLLRLLEGGGLLGLSVKTLVQPALAGLALTIGSPAAVKHVERAARSLKPSVRRAAKEVLEQQARRPPPNPTVPSKTPRPVLERAPAPPATPKLGDGKRVQLIPASPRPVSEVPLPLPPEALTPMPAVDDLALDDAVTLAPDAISPMTPVPSAPKSVYELMMKKMKENNDD